MSTFSDNGMQEMRAVSHVCRMAYSADEHGWSAEAFHAQVDTYGAAVVLGTSAGGSVFGAYNPRGWIGELCEDLVLKSCPMTHVYQAVSRGSTLLEPAKSDIKQLCPVPG